jgi:hypothetical protein
MPCGSRWSAAPRAATSSGPTASRRCQLLLALVLLGCTVVQAAPTNCTASDAAVLSARDTLCASLVGGPSSFCEDWYVNVTAEEDWPNQAVYMKNLLSALVSAGPCVASPAASSVVSWLNSSAMSDPDVSGNFANTWLVFQVQVGCGWPSPAPNAAPSHSPRAQPSLAGNVASALCVCCVCRAAVL